MSEAFQNKGIPPEMQLKQAVEKVDVFADHNPRYSHFETVREGVVIAIAELWPGSLDGLVYVISDTPPDITKRQTLLGRDEFDRIYSQEVTIDGLENLPRITSVYAGGYANCDPEKREEWSDLLLEACKSVVRDLEEIGLRELEF